MSRGKKIVELFTNLRTHIEDRDGEFDMGTMTIKPDSTNKEACVGCWLADYFETEPDHEGDRDYKDGINALERHLGIDDMDLFLESNKQHWHNCHAAYAFCLRGWAYDTNQYPSIPDVTDAWVSFW